MEPLILFCPNCGKQHLDTLEADGIDWSKRPHKTHLCKNTPDGPNTGCGHLWKPKETPTVGVLRVSCDPPEPSCPADRKPHRERIAEIVRLCPIEPKTAGVGIDDTPEHRAYYLHELAKHKEIKIVDQGMVGPGIYIIKITKTAVK